MQDRPNVGLQRFERPEACEIFAPPFQDLKLWENGPWTRSTKKFRKKFFFF